MAHFAELDTDNVVIRVVVISNDDILNDDNIEDENKGIGLCNQIAGNGIWVQTSYNNNFRRIFAQPGFKYSFEKEVFYDPHPPFDSWYLDGDYQWQPPVPYPDDDGRYEWDESSLSWKKIELPPIPPEPNDGGNYSFDLDLWDWVEIPSQ